VDGDGPAAADGPGALPDGATSPDADDGDACRGRNLFDRVCIDPIHSGHCEVTAGFRLTAVADRTCPPTSLCIAGHCQPPPFALVCQSQSDCLGGHVCDLYVGPSGVIGRCTDAISGGAGMYEDCTSDVNCRTGLCASFGNTQQCLYPCGDQRDCRGGGGCGFITSPALLEGVPIAGAVASCFN
jgi:hypothetical protein